MKRCISAVLIPCILFQLLSGCYSLQGLSKDEFIERAGKECLQVKLNSGKKIYYEPQDYLVRNDSIIGKGLIDSGSEEIPDKEFVGSIAMSEVESFSMEDFSIVFTIGGILLAGFLGTMLIFGILAGFK